MSDWLSTLRDARNEGREALAAIAKLKGTGEKG